MAVKRTYLSMLEKDASYLGLAIFAKLAAVLGVERAELPRKIEIGSTKYSPGSIKLAPRRAFEGSVHPSRA